MCAVAGAMRSRFARSASSMWPGRQFSFSSKKLVVTGFFESVWRVSDEINSVASCVMTTNTSCPCLTSKLASSADFKSAELASLLVKQGHEVFVVMTQDATEFISSLTLQTLSKNPVTTSFFDEKENWRPGHIELADRANLLLIAPATAHIIAELAHGLA